VKKLKKEKPLFILKKINKKSIDLFKVMIYYKIMEKQTKQNFRRNGT
jgi:hypothetical protein